MTLFGTNITADIGAELGDFFTITSISSLVSGVVGAALTVASLGVIIYFAWGAIQWLMSGGDKAKIEAAKSRITNALVGLTLVAVTWAVYATVDYLLGLPVQVQSGGSGPAAGTGVCGCGCGGSGGSGGYAADGALGSSGTHCYLCTGGTWVDQGEMTCPSITCYTDCN